MMQPFSTAVILPAENPEVMCDMAELSTQYKGNCHLQESWGWPWQQGRLQVWLALCWTALNHLPLLLRRYESQITSGEATGSEYTFLYPQSTVKSLLYHTLPSGALHTPRVPPRMPSGSDPTWKLEVPLWRASSKYCFPTSAASGRWIQCQTWESSACIMCKYTVYIDLSVYTSEYQKNMCDTSWKTDQNKGTSTAQSQDPRPSQTAPTCYESAPHRWGSRWVPGRKSQRTRAINRWGCSWGY